MIISHKLEFAFFGVPKTGSVTMTMALRETDLFDDDDCCSEIRILNNRAGEKVHFPALGSGAGVHMTPAEAVNDGLITEAQLNSYTCVAALRDPFARSVSSFAHAHSGCSHKHVFKAEIMADKDYGVLRKPQVDYFKYNGVEVCTPINFGDFQNAVAKMITDLGAQPRVMPNLNRTMYRKAEHNRADFIDADPEIEAKLRVDLAEDIALYESHYGTL